jgi:ubiquinone biosynthesis protein
MITGLANQFLMAFLGVGSGIVAAMLLGTSGGPKITPGLSLYQFIGYNLLIVAAILVLRVLFTILRSR